MIYIPSDNFSFRIDVYNTVSGAVLTCKVYGEEDTPNGTVPYLDSFNIIPNVTDASLYSSERRPTKKGIRVQSVNVVYTGSGNVQRGQIFVRGMMFYGDTDTIPAVVLFSDYVTSKNSPGYPGTGLVDSLSGRGYLARRTMTISPGITAAFVPGNNIFSKIYSMSVDGLMSADVKNRKVMAGVAGMGQYAFSENVFTAGQLFTLTFAVNNEIEKMQDPDSGVYICTEKLADHAMIEPGGMFTAFIYNNDYDGTTEDTFTSAYVMAETWIQA